MKTGRLFRSFSAATRCGRCAGFRARSDKISDTLFTNCNSGRPLRIESWFALWVQESMSYASGMPINGTEYCMYAWAG